MVAAALFAFALHAVVLGQPLTRAVGAPDPQQTQALHALFDATWEADMRRHPEWASYVGDHRYGDRLYDASPAARAAEFESARRSLARAQAIRRDALSAADQLSLDLFVHNLRDTLRLEPFAGYRSLSLGALGGFQPKPAEPEPNE